ncbi:MAG: hypothetical protein AAGA24_02575 [Pseudomonadota bacterium]
MAKPNQSPSVEHPCNTPIIEWMESQRGVMEIWLDRLIAEGDPDDLISMLHRHASWMDLMKTRLS